MDVSTGKVDLRFYEGDPSVVIAEREQALRTAGLTDVSITSLYELRPSLFDAYTTARVADYLRDEIDAEPAVVIMDYPGVLSLGVEGLQGKFGELSALGFTEPKKLFKEMPKIVRFATDTITEKIEGLQGIGFTQPTKLIAGNPRIVSFGIENVEHKLSQLADMGVKDPVTFCEKCPDVLSYSAERLKERIEAVEDVGILAIPAINKHPKLLMCSQERLTGTLSFLEELGVKDAREFMNRFPRVINFSHQNIRDKVNELGDLDVKHPVGLLERAPYVLSNSRETFAAKIACLAECGFSDPSDVVVKNPNLLARAEVAIQRRVRLIGKIVDLYGVDFDAKTLLEENPSLFNPSEARVMMMARLMASLAVQSGEKVKATDAVRTAFINTEAAIIAHTNLINQSVRPPQIGEWIQAAKKEKSPTTSKQKAVETILTSHTVDPKIQRTYKQKFTK